MNRYQAELYHYGIKGQKWGVRRSKEELKYNNFSVISSVSKAVIGSVTKNGIKISGVSNHVGDQAHERKVTAKAIIDATKKPLYIKPIKHDKFGRPSQQFIGEYATAVINPSTGTMTTIWKTGTKTRNKYKHGGT